MDQDWRIEQNAGDFFGHQTKRMQMEHRKPVIRRASDLVGPGINANATVITNFNDTLATFDGYFSAAAGASNAPTATQAYVGFVTSDATLGGSQVFYGLTDGGLYRRVFTRSPADASAVYFGSWIADVSDPSWTVIGNAGAPAFENSWVNFGGAFSTAAFMRKGGVVRLKGVVKSGSLGTTIFTLPTGYRPLEQLVISVLCNNTVGRLDIFPAGSVAATNPPDSSSVYINLDGVTFLAEQ